MKKENVINEFNKSDINHLNNMYYINCELYTIWFVRNLMYALCIHSHMWCWFVFWIVLYTIFVNCIMYFPCVYASLTFFHTLLPHRESSGTSRCRELVSVALDLRLDQYVNEIFRNFRVIRKIQILIWFTYYIFCVLIS